MITPGSVGDGLIEEIFHTDRDHTDKAPLRPAVVRIFFPLISAPRTKLQESEMMRPSTLTSGARLNITPIYRGGRTMTAFFTDRTPAHGRFHAINRLSFPAYAGINNPDDDDARQMSDDDMTNLASLAKIGDRI